MRLPAALTFLAYLVLGVAWIAPLRPLFLWMNTGRWTITAKPGAKPGGKPGADQ